MIVVLCGMMGAGKTAVGKVLAKQLGWRFLDTDEEIVRRHGAISKIFEKYGEEAFREIETQTLKEILIEKECILSVGGGLIVKAENRELLKQKGVTFVYLRARLETLKKRLCNDTTRPLLQGGERKLEVLYKARAGGYEAVADLIVEVDEKTPEEISHEIIKGAGMQ